MFVQLIILYGSLQELPRTTRFFVLLSRKVSSSDCKQLPRIIRNARHGLQRLLEAAAEMPPQSRTQPQSSKKTREFRNMIRRPNMHIGVHYPRQAEEYGVTNNSMVLAGESKHRYVWEQISAPVFGYGCSTVHMVSTFGSSTWFPLSYLSFLSLFHYPNNSIVLRHWLYQFM
jgi:hypothetical protein